LHIEGKTPGTVTELAFSDARRLGRIRLVIHPRDEPPISELGFDPILSMPQLWEFQALVLKRSCPIKALLLDQSFSAGVGNYLAGEGILLNLMFYLMGSVVR
jgi:formamidopyrimidine-DNA glycosylase